MPKQIKIILASTLALVLIISGVFFAFSKKQTSERILQNNQLIGALNSQSELVSSLQNRMAELEKRLGIINEQPKETTVINREVIKEKSQEEMLTAAVAKIAPAVVSIVITKDVPKLEITYENPFGNDPLFRDFGIRIPVYRQNGTEQQKIGAGTGFLIKSDGYIITNKHVVSDTAATYTALLLNGSQQTAQVVYRDQNNDIAVLKIPGNGYSSVSLGNSADLKLGQAVFAVGNALGEYNNSVSVGIISGLNRTIQASDNSGSTEQLTGVIQTDAAINPGNSGGPLVDLTGQVIGINVATVVGSNNISFSIPVDQIKSIIQSIVK